MRFWLRPYIREPQKPMGPPNLEPFDSLKVRFSLHHRGLILVKNKFQVPLGQRFEELFKQVYSLIVRCIHTVSYLTIAVLGSIILVLAPVLPLIAACASDVVAKLASPDYNSAWDWTGRERERYILDTSGFVIMASFVCIYQVYVLFMNLWILFH